MGHRSLRALNTTSLVLVTACLVGCRGGAMQQPTTNPDVPPSTQPNWEPAAPNANNFDWIQLKSGEWLKGRLHGMTDKKLEFDSEELDVQTFDWKDVWQVRSPHINDLLFKDWKTASGPIWITRDNITVEGPVPKSYPRSELESIAPGGAREADHWSGQVAGGLTLISGNTHQTSYNVKANLERRTANTTLTLDYLANFTGTNEQTIEDNQRAGAEFDLLLSKNLYLILPSVQYYRDPLQNIANQAVAGVGAGYYLINESDLKWRISAGPAYEHTWFDSVEQGQSSETSAAALMFGTRFKWDITRRLDLILEYQGLFTSEAGGGPTHHTVSTLELELTKRFNLDLSFVWDQISDPKTNSDGTTPDPNTYQFLVSLGLRF